MEVGRDVPRRCPGSASPVDAAVGIDVRDSAGFGGERVRRRRARLRDRFPTRAGAAATTCLPRVGREQALLCVHADFRIPTERYGPQSAATRSLLGKLSSRSCEHVSSAPHQSDSAPGRGRRRRSGRAAPSLVCNALSFDRRSTLRTCRFPFVAGRSVTAVWPAR